MFAPIRRAVDHSMNISINKMQLKSSLLELKYQYDSENRPLLCS
jgi:hypothetical protein